MRQVIKNLNTNRSLIILVLVAVALRIIFVVITYQFEGTSNWTDDFGNLYWGEQFAKGEWNLITSDWGQMIIGPAIPLIVAFFTLIFNDPIIPFFAYNIIVTSVMVIVLYYLGKEILNNKAGWILALWGVFFIEALKYSPHVLNEPTIFLFLPLTILLLIKSIKSNNNLWYIVFASLSYTWLIHTDERFFIYLPFFVLIFFFRRPFKINSFLKSTGIYIGLILILMLPWGIKNYQTYNQIVILTPRTTAITSHFFGEDVNQSFASHVTDKNTRKKLIEHRYDRAIEFGDKFGIQPRKYGKKERRIKAFINFWQPTYFQPTFIQYGYQPIKWSLKHNMASLLFYGIFLPFYIIGLFMLYRRKLYLPLFIGSIPIIHSLLHAYMVWPLERYRSPVTFIVVMIGIWTILEILKWVNKKYFQKHKYAKSNISNRS